MRSWMIIALLPLLVAVAGCLEEGMKKEPAPNEPTAESAAAPAATAAQPPERTQEETAGLMDIAISPRTVRQGDKISFSLTINRRISGPFDIYLLADAACGPFSIFENGTFIQGEIEPAATNVRMEEHTYRTAIWRDSTVPSWATPGPVTFYAVVTEAGKRPPVKQFSKLNESLPGVIAVEKQRMTIRE